MNDDRVVSLLEEIRDLQRQHVENYKEAVRNQQESIQLQKDFQARYQKRLLPLFVLVALVLAAIYSMPYLLRRLF